MGLSWRNLSWQIKSVMRPRGNDSRWLSFFTDFISALFVPTWQDLKALKKGTLLGSKSAKVTLAGQPGWNETQL